MGLDAQKLFDYKFCQKKVFGNCACMVYESFNFFPLAVWQKKVRNWTIESWDIPS